MLADAVHRQARPGIRRGAADLPTQGTSRAAVRARSRAARSRRPVPPCAPTAGGCARPPRPRPRRRRSAARPARRRLVQGARRSAVPELGLGMLSQQRAGERILGRVETTRTRGWPGSPIRRAWPAAIRSRSTPGRRLWRRSRPRRARPRRRRGRRGGLAPARAGATQPASPAGSGDSSLAGNSRTHSRRPGSPLAPLPAPAGHYSLRPPRL